MLNRLTQRVAQGSLIELRHMTISPVTILISEPPQPARTDLISQWMLFGGSVAKVLKMAHKVIFKSQICHGWART